jgi:3-phosphoshikimate 1-carboxyvinyltransferase
MTIRVSGEMVSEPYVAMTVQMLQEWGVAVHSPQAGVFVVPATPGATRPDYAIEPDASAASYFFAAAAITGGAITVQGMRRGMLQGDEAFVDLLARMGCRVLEADDGITVMGGPLRGIDCNMNAISDTVMTLAAVACFATGPTIIRDVAHVRHKETDRLAALAIELRKLGATVEERHDGLTITPAPLHGATVDTYNDHRMAMSLALIGLRVPGVVVNDPGCVAKTYPEYWRDLEMLRS